MGGRLTSFDSFYKVGRYGGWIRVVGCMMSRYDGPSFEHTISRICRISNTHNL